MKRIFTLAMILALGALLSSCKRPISGQLFVVTDAGQNFPLGTIQVEAIRGKDADAFMRQRQAEIEDKLRSLHEALNEMKTKYVAATKADSQAQSAWAAAELNQKAWGPKYAALHDEKVKELKAIDTLTETIDNLNQQLNQGGSTGGGSTSTVQRDEAYADLQNDEDRSRLLRRSVDNIDAQMDAIKNNFLAPYKADESSAARALAQAGADVNGAVTALKRFPTANDYFDGFSPDPIETTVTDAEGNFIIQHATFGAKIYARAQRQTAGSVENYFWLVDLPSRGKKLILSNNNLFTIPPNSQANFLATDGHR